MLATIDQPAATETVDRFGFFMKGWVWMPEAQRQIAAVESWSAGEPIGRSGSLHVRPDVNHALRIAPQEATGFELVARTPQARRGEPLVLELRVRLQDGTVSEPLCRRIVATFGAGEQVSTPAMDPVGAPAGQRAATEFAPPAHLQVRQVAGVWGPKFFGEGRVIFGQVAQAFALAGRPLERTAAVLDFGCGCGRVLRAFEGSGIGADLWGCDIDPEAIAWNQRYLAHIARFCVNPTMPPTAFATGQFDAIYAVSVFTHLPEELQFAWLTELRRILRPGGVLVASVHGGHYSARTDLSVQEELARRGFAYRSGAATEGLPDFYMVAFHSEAYVRARWARFFELVAWRERFIHGVHDAVILRRTTD